MYSAAQNAASNNQTQKNIAAFILLICFITVSFLPVSFLVIHANHDCAAALNTECHVCVKINGIKKLLEQTGKVVTLFIAGAALLTAAILARPDAAGIFPVTLFQYKVRLNT